MRCLPHIGRFLNIALVKSCQIWWEGLPPDDLDLLKKFFVNVVGIPDCLGELGGLLLPDSLRLCSRQYATILERAWQAWHPSSSFQESLTQQDLEARLRVPLSQEKIGVSNCLCLPCGEIMRNIDLASLQSAVISRWSHCTQLVVTSEKLGGMYLYYLYKFYI